MPAGKNPYTPSFIIYVNGTRFSGEQEASVEKVIVTERINVVSKFSILMSDPQKKWVDSRQIETGAKIKIMIGYKDSVKEVMEWGKTLENLSGGADSCKIYIQLNEKINPTDVAAFYSYL